jgi:protein arginine kinase activator
MLCQKCHRSPATVKYAEVVDGKVVHQDLCAECLDTYQRDASSAFSLGESKPAVHAPVRGPRTAPQGGGPAKACPSCGDTLAQVLEGATVGCPACYRHFGAEVEAVLEGLHRGMRHQGKTPRVDDGRARLHAQLQHKRTLLRSVLRLEDYEQAAVIRDEIKRLDAALRHSGRELD